MAKRKPNFDSEELKVLVESYNQRKDIIEAKFSNVVTKKDISDAWNQIKDNVNAVNKKGFKRTAEDIKRKYITFKSEVKAKAAKMNGYCRQTGGGPPLELTLDPIEELVVNTINPQLINGIDGWIDTQLDESQTNEDTIIVSDGQSDSILVYETNEQSFEAKPKSQKRKYQSVGSDCQLKTISDSMLDLEREKLQIKKTKLNLLQIYIKLKIKSLTEKGVDCSQELHELNEIIN